MGKYIYEGHMGSLFTSDESLDFEDRYCEQCGDSDWEIGYAENAETAFMVLSDMTDTFDSSVCNLCPHREDYDFCDEECDEYAKSGGYSLSYVMNFLYQEFSDVTPFSKIYTVLVDDNGEGYVMVGFDKYSNHKHFLPHSYLISSMKDNQSFKNILSFDLLAVSDGEPSDVTFCYEENDTIVFKATEKITEEMKNTSHWCNDGWYGFMKVDDLDLSEDEMKIVKKVLEMSA